MYLFMLYYLCYCYVKLRTFYKTCAVPYLSLVSSWHRKTATEHIMVLTTNLYLCKWIVYNIYIYIYIYICVCVCVCLQIYVLVCICVFVLIIICLKKKMLFADIFHVDIESSYLDYFVYYWYYIYIYIYIYIYGIRINIEMLG